MSANSLVRHADYTTKWIVPVLPKPYVRDHGIDIDGIVVGKGVLAGN